jgi:hypothetical protein
VDSQEKWDAIKPLVSRLDPEFAKQAGDVFVPEKFAMFKNIGVTAEQQHKMAEDALQSFAKGDKAHGLALAVAGTTDDKDLQGALQYAQANGTPAFMLQKYQGVKWSPELVAAAKADVIGPEKSAELEQKGVVQDRMTAADAERERHNRAMEAHGQAIEARMAAGGASKAGAGPEITIKPNTRESRIATDVATGRLPYADWQRMYGRGAQFAEKKAAMYDYARQINPDFDVASYEAGLKVAGNPKIVMQVSSLNNVMSGVPDLLAASNAADSAGLRILNSYIKKGGFTIGGKAYSNLNTARTAFADELSGALGYGSATDMSRDMGFSMTDSTLPPDKFAAAIQDIVVPFVERKKRSILGGMGVYGQPGRSPASTEQHGQFDVQDPNGKWHPFTDQAASNRFKAAIAKAHP